MDTSQAMIYVSLWSKFKDPNGLIIVLERIEFKALVRWKQ